MSVIVLAEVLLQTWSACPLTAIAVPVIGLWHPSYLSITGAWNATYLNGGETFQPKIRFFGLIGLKILLYPALFIHLS